MLHNVTQCYTFSFLVCHITNLAIKSWTVTVSDETLFEVLRSHATSRLHVYSIPEEDYHFDRNIANKAWGNRHFSVLLPVCSYKLAHHAITC